MAGTLVGASGETAEDMGDSSFGAKEALLNSFVLDTGES
jgi:hypothetical protein